MDIFPFQFGFKIQKFNQKSSNFCLLEVLYLRADAPLIFKPYDDEEEYVVHMIM